jgi:IclR family transcriptional regulator, KDG regulon repressor
MQDKNKTVVKSMDLLNLFRNYPKLSLGEMVQLSGIPKTSVHRMVGSLQEMGFIKKEEDNKYSLGFLFLEFGQLVKERIDIRKIALPIMYSLREDAREAVNLVIKQGNEAIYIEKLETMQPVRVYTKIGRRAPLYGGACPRILLAFLPESELEQYVKQTELKPIATDTITDKDYLLQVLAESKKNGYSISHSELQDYSSAVAAPIFDSLNQVVAGISLVGPSMRFQEEHLSKLIELVKKAANEISYKLGWKGLDRI